MSGVVPYPGPIGMPPQSIEAEEAILGAMMHDGFAVEKANEIGLTEAMFVRADHRLIYRTAMRIVEEGTATPDELMVVNRLKARNELAAAGGHAAVLSLVERRLPVANSRAYAKEVRDTAILRSLVQRGHQIAALGYEHPDEPEALILRAGQIIDEMTDRAAGGEVETSTLADQLMPFYDDMAERRERGSAIAGLATGFTALDERWGGLQNGRLYVIAGRPGMGKSALAGGIAENVVFGNGVDVYLPNLEMSNREQTGRTLARVASLNLHRITNSIPTDEDFQTAHDTITNIHESAKLMHMDECAGMTVAQIAQRARRLNRRLRRQGRRIQAVFVDYLQKIAYPVGINTEYAAVTFNCAKLDDLAQELDCPVILLSQLNRSVEERPDKTPNMGDLRGSGGIEQDADCIALLYRPGYYLKDQTPPEWVGVAQIETAKMRNGRPGVDLLRWQAEHTRFSDYTPPVFVAGTGGYEREVA